MQKKYYLFELKDKTKWNQLLTPGLRIAEYATFYPLWPDWHQQDDLRPFRENTVKTKGTDRILGASKFLKLKLNDDLRDFIKSKPFDFWKNYYWEDLTLVKSNREFFATKSRKDQVILFLSEKERELLIKQGFDIFMEVSDIVK